MPKGILGRKIGMTQVLDQETGAACPATVIEAGPCVVLQVKTVDTDGYGAIQLGYGDKKPKNTPKPLAAHFEKAGTSPKRLVREIRTSDAGEFEQGQVLTVETFAGIQKVDIQGTSKGRGWTGTIKRWNMHRQNTSHGNTKHHRALGSLGRTYSVHKGVPKGKKMPGHYGNEKVTARGLRLLRIVPEEGLLVVKGSVPGPNGGFLVIRQSQKDPAYKP